MGYQKGADRQIDPKRRKRRKENKDSHTNTYTKENNTMCIKWALQKNKKCCQLTAKTYLYVGLSLLSLGTLMSFLSLICPYWRTGYGRDEGLYYYCSGGDCHHLGEIDSGEEGWWRFV